MADKLKRLVECYRRGGDDDLVAEYDLPDIPLKHLQELFGQHPDQLMYDSYRIAEDHAAFFKRHVRLPFDFEHYDYFLACHLEDGE